MPMLTNAVKGVDIVYEEYSADLCECPKKISALNYSRNWSTGKDESLKERGEIGPLFIQLDLSIRLLGFELC